MSLPVRATSSSAATTADSSVPAWAMSSTPGMKGAGLEKCTPRNRPACCRFTASPLIGRVEVLLPMTASGRAAASIAASTGPLTAGFSETASSM